MTNVAVRFQNRLAGEVRGTGQGKVRIAIADDDPDSIDLMKAALTGPAIEIEEATSGAGLVGLLTRRGPFDVIVTDVLMPWSPGLQVLRAARRTGWTTPVVLVTGLTDPSIADKVAGLGKARLLRKPFAIADLRSAVAEVMRAPRCA